MTKSEWIERSRKASDLWNARSTALVENEVKLAQDAGVLNEWLAHVDARSIAALDGKMLKPDALLIAKRDKYLDAIEAHKTAGAAVNKAFVDDVKALCAVLADALSVEQEKANEYVAERAAKIQTMLTEIAAETSGRRAAEVANSLSASVGGTVGRVALIEETLKPAIEFVLKGDATELDALQVRTQMEK